MNNLLIYIDTHTQIQFQTRDNVVDLQRGWGLLVTRRGQPALPHKPLPMSTENSSHYEKKREREREREGVCVCVSKIRTKYSKAVVSVKVSCV
jgi:hypothetical protein